MKIITSLGGESKPIVATFKTQCVLQLWETTILSFQCTHTLFTDQTFDSLYFASEAQLNKVMEMLEISIYGLLGLILLKIWQHLCFMSLRSQLLPKICNSLDHSWSFYVPIMIWICLFFFLSGPTSSHYILRKINIQTKLLSHLENLFSNRQMLLHIIDLITENLLHALYQMKLLYFWGCHLLHGFSRLLTHSHSTYLSIRMWV